MPFHWLPESTGKAVAVKAEGTLTDADYQEFLPRLEAVIAEHGRIRLLVDMESFDGWEAKAAWDDFTFGMTHWNHFERIALIGDAAWEKVSVQIMDLLMGGEARFFEPNQSAEARAWIAEG